jgi:hypothetical protein
MIEALTEMLLAKAAGDYIKTKQLYKEAAASISSAQLKLAEFPDTPERSAVNFQLQRAYDLATNSNPAYAEILTRLRERAAAPCPNCGQPYGAGRPGCKHCGYKWQRP